MPADLASEKKQLLEKVYWIISLRYAAIGIALFLGFVGTVGAQAPFRAGNILLGIALLVFLYNFLVWLFIKKNEQSISSNLITALCFSQLLIDAIVTTILIQATGGILSSFILMYLFGLIFVGIIAPDRPYMTQLLALFTILLYEIILVLNSYGFLNPITLVQHGREVYQDFGFLLFQLIVFPTFAILAAFMSSGLAAYLKKGESVLESVVSNLQRDVSRLQTLDHLRIEFLSRVNHELRTPITSIKGYVSLLAAGKVGLISPAQQDTLDIICRQSDYLQNLITNLSDATRLEIGQTIPLEKSSFAIGELVNEVSEAVTPLADNKGLVLTTDLAANLPPLTADRLKIKRLLTNLIGNAISFTQKGGRISVKALLADGKLRIEIADNGIGIEKKHLDKIFGRFYQVDNPATRAAGGIGMGLAIAKELVELHGGRLWAESAGLGKGSKFSFTIPIKS